MRIWQFAEAEANFDEMISSAENGEPQLVVYEGEEVIVLNIAQYRRLLVQKVIDETSASEEEGIS
jgi:hypothetical protein